MGDFKFFIRLLFLPFKKIVCQSGIFVIQKRYLMEELYLDQPSKKSWILIIAGIVLAALIIGAAVFYFLAFGAPEQQAQAAQFTVPQNASLSAVVANLKTQGLIKNSWAFDLVLKLKHIDSVQAGAYKLSASMNAWALATALEEQPYMKWVVIPEGLRKEEIADILATALGWSDAQKTEWIKVDTAQDPDYFEGVYFPDTYLIPVGETPLDTAHRLQAKFQEKFAPYAKEALQQNIKWTTALKLASIVQREAAGASDMPLIAGILWNRLLQNMKLQVDATVQYARGNTGNGWWAPLSVKDLLQIDSPYNTYLNAGLPPHPICNPGLAAISAALNPQSTQCLYYIHDSSKNIHCAVTYEEQQQNIEKYLR